MMRWLRGIVAAASLLMAAEARAQQPESSPTGIGAPSCAAVLSEASGRVAKVIERLKALPKCPATEPIPGPEEAQEEIAALQKKFTEATAALKAKEAELAKALEERNSARAALGPLNAELDRSRHELSEAKRRIDSATEEIGRLSKQRNELIASNKLTKSDLDDAGKNLAETESRLGAATKEIGALAKQRDDLHRLAAKEIGTLSRRRNELRTMLDEIKRKLDWAEERSWTAIGLKDAAELREREALRALKRATDRADLLAKEKDELFVHALEALASSTECETLQIDSSEAGTIRVSGTVRNPDDLLGRIAHLSAGKTGPIVKPGRLRPVLDCGLPIGDEWYLNRDSANMLMRLDRDRITREKGVALPPASACFSLGTDFAKREVAPKEQTLSFWVLRDGATADITNNYVLCTFSEQAGWVILEDGLRGRDGFLISRRQK